MEGKFYKIVVWPSMMYRSEYWILIKKEEIKIKVVKMRIPRWMCNVASLNKISNE